MDHSLNLVSAMRLDTEFLQGAHKHRRQVPKHKLKDGESPIQQIEEIWDKEYNRDSHIGSGAFGHVWYERRRPLTFDPTQTSHTQSRAVKQILKAVNPNYIRELQAIATFSQDRVSWAQCSTLSGCLINCEVQILLRSKLWLV